MAGVGRQADDVDIIRLSLLYVINSYIATITVTNKEALLKGFS